jgi:hypothetical protein
MAMTLKSHLEKSKRGRVIPAEEAKKRGALVWFVPKRQPEVADRGKSRKPKE